MNGRQVLAAGAIAAACAASAAAQISTQTLCLVSPSGYRLEIEPVRTNAQMHVPALNMAGVRTGVSAVPQPVIDYSAGGAASGALTAPGAAPAPRSRETSRRNQSDSRAGSAGAVGTPADSAAAPGWGWLAEGMKTERDRRTTTLQPTPARAPFDRAFSPDGAARFDLAPSAFDNAFDRQPAAKPNPFGPRRQTDHGR